MEDARITTQDIAKAVEQAMRAVLQDPEIRKDFWRAGYEELSEHASKGAAGWVGKASFRPTMDVENKKPARGGLLKWTSSGASLSSPQSRHSSG